MKICLIGSTRFMPLYREANRKLSLAGHIVYTVAQVSSSADQEDVKVEVQANPISVEEKETLDLVHFCKILESEAVMLITDATGYYGESTRRELKLAAMTSKAMLHFSDIPKIIADSSPAYNYRKKVGLKHYS